MPKRFGWTVTTIVAGLLLSAVLIMYLAFSAGPDAPSRIQSVRVASEGTVSWSEMGGTSVQAGSFQDALYMLGYGHARSRSWQMVLWRQAAMGRPSEWFGPDALPADRLIRRLRIPDGAERAWQSLDPDSQQLLAAYAAGIDDAITARDLNRAAPFLILDIESESWQAEHSIAVERLFAWLSSAPDHADPSLLPSDWDHADRLLQQLLAFHGSAVNWVAGIQHAGEPYVSARLATGSTGIPLFSETDIDYGSGRFTGVIVPGALIPLVGSTHADAWALTGRSHREVTQVMVPGSAVRTTHHRLRFGDQEEVVAGHEMAHRLVVDDPPRADQLRSVRTLDWSGSMHGSDAATWLGALSGDAPRPRLLVGEGVRWAGAGFTPSGTPATVIQPVPGVVFVTSAPSALSPRETVAGLSSAPAITSWLTTTLSLAAENTLGRVVSNLPDSLLSDRRDQEALRYLTNWNLEYGAAEPGASILETLLSLLPDSSATAQAYRSALTETVSKLGTRYGPDMSSWRWETVQERGVTFPGSGPSTADGGRPEERFLDKYQPVLIRASGHPQSLVWGSPPSQDSMRTTSAWEGALSLRNDVLYFRRPSVDFNRFLGTFLTGDRPPALQTLRQSVPDESTTFIPAR